MLDFILKFCIASGVFMVAAMDTFIICMGIDWIKDKIKERKGEKPINRY